MERATLEPPQSPDSETVSGASRGLHRPGTARGKLRGTPAFVWKYLVGVLGCQNPVTALVVVGWSYRLARRTAVKAWWQRSPCRQAGGSFRQFVREADGLADLESYPNWFRAESSAAGLPVWKRLPRALFGSLWENARIGLKAIFNTWVLTLLPGLIMLFSWYAGWNNSFTKGYEHAVVGPATGLFGIALLIAVLFYLPMAQARQAVTGEGAPFYHFRDNRQLIRLRWHLLALLAFGYAAFGLVLMVMSSFLGFLPEALPELLEATPPEQLAFLQRYFIVCGLFVFPAHVVLRCWAAKIYAGALLHAYGRGLLRFGDLRPFEQEMFHKLQLAQSTPPRASKLLSPRQRQWLLSLPGRVTTGFLAAFLWFVLAAETYVAQFINYQDTARWLNHPLIQLPWFHHIPGHLKAAAKDYEEGDG